MASSYDLLVRARGDSRDAQKSLRDLQAASQRFNSGFGRHMKSAAKWGSVALGAGLAATVKIGAAELAEAAKVGAQTNAVIRSTGGAAGFSRKEFEKLASSLMKVSGVDDEVIQSGENLLATFVKVKGKAFDGATRAALDMSVALGEDLNSSVMRIGKALNDPIKGVTALRRVGVQLTAQQEKQIKSFVKQGDVMRAQKVILRELNTEFGGSAKAFGQTGPGQIEKAKRAFEELAANLTGRVAPSFGTVAREATQVIQSIDRWSRTADGAAALDQARYAAEQFGGALRLVGRGGVEVARGAAQMSGTLLPLAGAVLGAVAGYKAYKTAVDGAKAAQLAFNVASKGNPIGLAVGAAAALGTAFLATKMRMSESEKAIRANERAMKDLRAQASAQIDLELAMESGNVALQRATVEYQRAGVAVRNTKKGTKEYREAVLQQREALVAVKQAQRSADKATDEYNKSLRKSKTEAKEVTDRHRALVAEKRRLVAILTQDTSKFRMGSAELAKHNTEVRLAARRYQEVVRELKRTGPAASEAARKFDLMTGKALAGGAGFAKMRRQMQQLNDEINAIPSSKTFTLNIVKKYSGISNPFKGPDVLQPKSGIRGAMGSRMVGPFLGGKQTGINSLGQIIGVASAADALEYANLLNDPTAEFLQGRVQMNQYLLNQAIQNQTKLPARIAALRAEIKKLSNEIRKLNRLRKKTESAKRRKQLAKMIKAKAKRIQKLKERIEKLTGQLEQLPQDILQIASDIASDQDAIEDMGAGGAAGGSGGSGGGSGGGLAAVLGQLVSSGYQVSFADGSQSSGTVGPGAAKSSSGAARGGTTIIVNAAGSVLNDPHALAGRLAWELRNRDLAGRM
jgi:hypothetical protein